MTNPNAELGFLRRVAVAENPRIEFANLVRAHQMPAGFAVKYAANLKQIMAVLCLNGNGGATWATKIGQLKKFQPELPVEVFTSVVRVLIERYRVEKGEISDPMLVVTPVAADNSAMDLEASLADWQANAGQRSEYWERQRLIELLGNLSAKQLITLASKNPTLFDANAEFEVDSTESGAESFKLSDYLTGWAGEIQRSSDDKLAIASLKKEVLGVLSGFIEEFSKSERELLWQEIKSISRHMLGSRRRKRRQGEPEDQFADGEFISKFEEARAKLPLSLQAKLDALPQDKAMLKLVVWLRRAARLEPAKIKQLGLNKGDFVLQYEWLNALENHMQAELYKRLLARARARMEKTVLVRWRQLRSLVSGPMTSELENYLFDQLRLVKEKYEVFKTLPERVHRQVYGVEVTTRVQVRVDKKSAEEPTRFPTLATALMSVVTKAEDVTTSQPKKAKKPKALNKKRGAVYAKPQLRKKHDRGTGPQMGDRSELIGKLSASEVAQALSLVPRNKGVSHKKRREASISSHVPANA